MKTIIKSIIIVLSAVFMPLMASGQGKIYTRKARLEDFPSKTTKIVLSGDAVMQNSLRESVASTWRISAYDFCTPADFEAQKSADNFYFLHVASIKGTPSLVLTKGGVQSADDSRKQAFDVIKVPFGDEYAHLDALLDIIQTFVEDATMSDFVAYAGLKYYNAQGQRMIKKYSNEDPSRLVKVDIDDWSIIYDRDTHELYSFRKF